MERLRNRLDVYRADLAQIVSKYIGETERRLGALFTRAESRDAVVILDEGDDLFGNRGEVRVVSKDAEDQMYLDERSRCWDGAQPCGH